MTLIFNSDCAAGASAIAGKEGGVGLSGVKLFGMQNPLFTAGGAGGCVVSLGAGSEQDGSLTAFVMG